MLILVIGLLLFLGVHAVRIVADGWRTRMVAAHGPGLWKGVYTVVSLAGFALIVLGFHQARQDPVALWYPPRWTHHATGLLTLIAFVLLAAAYVPGNKLKASLHHPMVLAVKTWAFAHLLANGRLADVVLFGAFLAWAVADFASARRRDRAAGTAYPPGRTGPTVVTVLVGVAAWALFAFVLHRWLIGVAPFGPLEV